MREIPLRDIKRQVVGHTRVSDEDYDHLAQYYWHKTKGGYAKASPRSGVQIWMHRLIYERTHGHPPICKVDHQDRDRLNNQRDNLRAATDLENALNKSLGKHNTTGYFGVRFDRRTQRYQAYSTYQNKWFSIGYFDLIEDAALAHDLHMKRSYPNEFLNLNCAAATVEDAERINALLANPKQRKGKSRYRGVIHFPWGQRVKCWHARIRVDGCDHLLGYHLTQEEAALAYNVKATELLGDRAILNIIP